MESVACKHIERIEEYHNHALGTCTLCGQIRRYDQLDYKQSPTIIKIGRINGMPTLEHPPKEVIKVVKNKPEVETLADILAETEVAKRKYKARKPVRDYEADKEDIVEDYDTLSLKEFYAKQHLAPSTWTKLKRKWGVKGKSPRKAKPVLDAEAPTVHKGKPLVSLGTFTVEAVGKLPAFPEFNDSWPMLTQIAWLETYKALKELLRL